MIPVSEKIQDPSKIQMELFWVNALVTMAQSQRVPVRSVGREAHRGERLFHRVQ